MILKFLRNGLLFAVVSLLVVACSDDSDVEPEESGEDVSAGSGRQEIAFATSSDAVGLPPLDTNDSVAAYMLEQLYDTLLVHNPEPMEVEPHLVACNVSLDAESWLCKLTEGIEFHDGTPSDAEAVKYAFEQLLEEERAEPRASLLDPVESIEVEVECSVTINPEEPDGPL